MAGQFPELLMDVARKLEGVERMLARLQEDQKEQNAKVLEIMVRIAQIEQDRKWTGEDRREVHDRLGTGDHTFLKLQHEVNEAARIAKWCRDAIQRKPQESTKRQKWVGKALEYGAPIVAAVILQLLYHILMVGPQIAAAIKKAGEGH